MYLYSHIKLFVVFSPSLKQNMPNRTLIQSNHETKTEFWPEKKNVLQKDIFLKLKICLAYIVKANGIKQKLTLGVVSLNIFTNLFVFYKVDK